MSKRQPEPLALSAAEIKELTTRYKQERDRRIAERIQCIILYAQGYSLKELRRILHVGVKTLIKWIKVFCAQGLDGLYHWGYKGRKSEPWPVSQDRLSDEQWAEVEKELERKPYHSAKDVAAFVKERFHIEYSKRGMQALLRRKGYRYIKGRIVPGKAPDEKKQQAFVDEYLELKSKLGPQDRIYFVVEDARQGDAAHPTHNVRISYIWTKKGRRWRIKSNTGRKRYNILGAYCPLDGEYIDIRGIDNINAETLQRLIDKIRARHPEAGRIILFLDNARYNHARLVSEHIVDTNVELHFLPTYSPNLNLVERLWRFVKDEVMNDTYYESFEEFIAAIDNVLDNLDQYITRLATLMTEKFEFLSCA